MSNALSQRGAFQQVVEAAAEKKRSSVAPPDAPGRAKKPGTEMMPNAPHRPLPLPSEAAGPSADTPEPKKMAPARTVAMGFAPNMPQSVAQPSGPMQPQSVAQPSGPMQPQSAGQPSAAPYMQPQNAMQPSSVRPSSVQPPNAMHAPSPAMAQHPMGQHPMGQHPMGTASPYYQPQGYPPQPPYAAQPPAGPAGWGWNAAAAAQHAMQQAPPPGQLQYPFSYAPGSRVHVTWSNGQRYPATVTQVSGAQCLVVFPDGQQHWVEVQYLSPG